MPEPRTCHLFDSTALFYNGVGRLGQAEALWSHCPHIIVSDISKLGGRR
ncbi:MAG: hypothetical protein NVSMB33_02110 [Ktedonobacteraceae bacterium]